MEMQISKMQHWIHRKLGRGSGLPENWGEALLPAVPVWKCKSAKWSMEKNQVSTDKTVSANLKIAKPNYSDRIRGLRGNKDKRKFRTRKVKKDIVLG